MDLLGLFKFSKKRLIITLVILVVLGVLEFLAILFLGYYHIYRISFVWNVSENPLILLLFAPFLSIPSILGQFSALYPNYFDVLLNIVLLIVDVIIVYFLVGLIPKLFKKSAAGSPPAAGSGKVPNIPSRKS
jgi:hypothetical protein